MSPRRHAGATGQHALDHAALEPRVAAGLGVQAGLVHPFDRGAERRIDRLRQAGAVIHRLEACPAPVVHQRGDAARRKLGELGERLLEEVDVAGEQRAQHQPGVELAGLAQMADQRRDFGRLDVRREDHGRLLAGFLRDALRPALVEPVARDREARERLGHLDDQRVAGRGGKVVPGEQRLADRREMAETRHDAVEREQRDVGAGIFDQRQAGFRRSRLRRARRRPSAAGRRGARSRTASSAPPIAIASTRSESSRSRRAFEHDRRDVRLVVDQRMHHGGRRFGLDAERVGERVAHQRRRIVEQHDHRAFGGDAVVFDQVGVQIGAGERRGGFRAFRGFRGTHPLQKMPYDHDATTT